MLSSSASIVTGFRQISARVRELVLPGRGVELRESDKRKLLAIQKRVECLVQPLNFCVMWSKNKSTCIQPIVRYGQDIIDSVSSSIDCLRFVQSDTDAFVKTLDEDSALKLEYLLSELEFACSSVNMAVSLTTILKESPVDSGKYLSPAALLKASSRVQAMHGNSGDLVTIDGRLFSKTDKEDIWSELYALANLRLSKSNDSYTIRITGANDAQLNLPVSLNSDFTLSTTQSIGINQSSTVDAAVLTWSQVASVARSDVSMESSSDADLVIVTRRMTEAKPTLFAIELRASAEDWSPIELLYLSRLCSLESGGRSHLQVADEVLNETLSCCTLL